MTWISARGKWRPLNPSQNKNQKLGGGGIHWGAPTSRNTVANLSYIKYCQNRLFTASGIRQLFWTSAMLGSQIPILTWE